MGLESQDLVSREAQPCACPTGGKAPARWFITDAGRAMAQAIQTLSQDALVILQQAVSLAKDEQIAGIEPLRAVVGVVPKTRGGGQRGAAALGRLRKISR